MYSSRITHIRDRIVPTVIGLYLMSFWMPEYIQGSLIVLTVGAAAAALYAPTSRQTVWPWPDALVVGFVLSLALSVLYSGHKHVSLLLSTPFFPALLIYLLLTRFQITERACWLIYAAMALGASLFGITILVNARTMTLDTEQLQKLLSTGILVVPNDVLFLAVSLPFILVLAWAAKSGWLKAVAAIAGILCLATMVILNSRAALVASLIGTMVFLAVVRSRRWWFAMILGGVAVLVADGIRGFDLLSKFVQHSLECESRLPLWGAAIRLWMDRPIWGQGAHNFQGLYRAQIDSLGLPVCALVDKRLTPWPHNLFLEVLSSQGLVGAIFLVALLGWVSLRLYSLTRAKSSPTQFQAVALLAAWTAFVVAALVELTFSRYWVVVMFSTLIGLTVAVNSDFETDRKIWDEE